MACRIMVQGTASGAGVSYIAAGLCRLFNERGLSAALFSCRPETSFSEAAYAELSCRVDVVVIEGKGNPTDCGAVQGMHIAAMTDSPVLLVLDAERGGFVASAYGTLSLLAPDDLARVKGLVINKCPYDGKVIARDAKRLEELSGLPVLGVIALLAPEEESASSFSPLSVTVLRFPHVSDFRDSDALDRHPAFGVRRIAVPEDFGEPDLLILPDTDDMSADLFWLRSTGLSEIVRKYAEGGAPVLGLGDGGAMLGADCGLGVVPVSLRRKNSGTHREAVGRVGRPAGIFSCLSGIAFTGYGCPGEGGPETGASASFASVVFDSGDAFSTGTLHGNVLTVDISGMFETSEMAEQLAAELLRRKGIDDYESITEEGGTGGRVRREFSADLFRKSIDLEALYAIMGL